MRNRLIGPLYYRIKTLPKLLASDNWQTPPQLLVQQPQLDQNPHLLQALFVSIIDRQGRHPSHPLLLGQGSPFDAVLSSLLIFITSEAFAANSLPKIRVSPKSFALNVAVVAARSTLIDQNRPERKVCERFYALRSDTRLIRRTLWKSNDFLADRVEGPNVAELHNTCDSRCPQQVIEPGYLFLGILSGWGKKWSIDDGDEDDCAEKCSLITDRLMGSSRFSRSDLAFPIKQAVERDVSRSCGVVFAQSSATLYGQQMSRNSRRGKGLSGDWRLAFVLGLYLMICWMILLNHASNKFRNQPIYWKKLSIYWFFQASWFVDLWFVICWFVDLLPCIH